MPVVVMVAGVVAVLLGAVQGDGDVRLAAVAGLRKLRVVEEDPGLREQVEQGGQDGGDP
jgi:hypothetical protein